MLTSDKINWKLELSNAYLLVDTPGVKGYKLWCLEPGYNKCIISRDVIFDETQMAKLHDYTTSKPSVSEEKTRFEVELLANQNSRIDHSLTEREEDTEIQTTQPQTTQHEVQNQYMLARDRQRRQIKLPRRYAQADIVAFALNIASVIDDYEPGIFKEAVNSSSSRYWKAAMNEEMNSLMKNNTWELVPRSKGKKIIGCRWIFKRKDGIAGVERQRFKARVVAKGFTQVQGVDYNEIYSPVVKHTSIRMILSLVAHNNLKLKQMDVQTAFLHGALEEIIYMQQPEGYIAGGDGDKVCLLKKSLYGLKQSPRQWYKRFDDYILSCGFSRCNYDSCVYFKRAMNVVQVYLLLYVDDILIARNDRSQVLEIKKILDS